MRVVLDLYTNGGQLQGCVRASDDTDPVRFSGVLELLAALEQLGPEPFPDDDGTNVETESP